MAGELDEQSTAAQIHVALDRDAYLREVLHELAGTLEKVVGREAAAGFVSVAGRAIGRRVDADYRGRHGAERLDREAVAEAILDFTRRVGGDFYLIEATDERIVLGNRACPFGDAVAGRPSLCMMTSNVLGTVAAENVGYAKVELSEAIARGHPGCRVVLHLRMGHEARAAHGREYFRGDR
jgi:predicted ArsR family transcriptional regulator